METAEHTIDRLAAPGVRVFAGFRVALRYHALSMVPLPGDDASLHREDYAAPWRRTLERAGVAAETLDRLVLSARAALSSGPRRLAHQVEVIARPDLPLGRGPLGELEAALEPTYREAWTAAADATETCRLSFGDLVVGRSPLLAPVRLAGIELLDLHLCPALGTAGRAARVARACAVALPLPADEAERAETFVQLVHECCHPLADDTVAAAAPAEAHDTARGSPGHAVHALREDAALVVGYHWLAPAPRLLDDYVRWASRFRRRDRLEERLEKALDLPERCRAAVLDRAAQCSAVTAKALDGS